MHANRHVIPTLPHVRANIRSVQIVPSTATVGSLVDTQETAKIRVGGILNTHIECAWSGRSDSDFNSPHVRCRQRAGSAACELFPGLPAIGGAENAVQSAAADVSKRRVSNVAIGGIEQ